VIGCGNMGGGMAMTLHNEGQNVLCFDPAESTTLPLKNSGLSIATSAIELAGQVNQLILSLPTAEIVEAVMHEISSVIKPGCVVVDTSTSKPGTSQKLSKLAKENGYHFLDAPVSGGPSAAITGSMTMLIGGDKDAFEQVKPVLELLTSKLVEVGPSGAGHAAKIANNMLCAANLILVGEAIKLAEAVGVNAENLLEGVNAGSGRSGVSEVNYPRWILNNAYDSGFSMGLMRKDVNLAMELAEQNNIDLQGFSTLAQLWQNSSDCIADSEDFNRIYEHTE